LNETDRIRERDTTNTDPNLNQNPNPNPTLPYERFPLFSDRSFPPWRSYGRIDPFQW